MIKLIENKLYLFDIDEKTIINSFEPFCKIEEFKKVKENCIIVREEYFNEDINNHSNIYCLDNNLNIIWFAKSPFRNETFVNPIRWDLEFYEIKTGIAYRKNENTFVCSTWGSVTVNIDYLTGKILKKMLTK